MSFADDIRNNCVEKPQEDPYNPNAFDDVARRVIESVKESLMNNATIGNVKSQHLIGKLGEKKYIETQMSIHENVTLHAKELRINKVCYTSYPGLCTKNRVATIKLYSIIKSLCASENIEVSLKTGYSQYESGNCRLSFKVYL